MFRARLARGLALALCASVPAAATTGTMGASSASAVTSAPGSHTPTFPVPASERVHGAGAATAGTPATPAAGASTPGAAGAAGARTTPAVGTGAGAIGAPATTTPTGAPSGATPGTAPATTVPTIPVRPGASALPATARDTKAGSKRLSAGAIVAAALAALLIVVCLAWGAARWFAYEPRWVVSLRHSLAEAGWRLSASWDEFADWARIGR